MADFAPAKESATESAKRWWGSRRQPGEGSRHQPGQGSSRQPGQGSRRQPGQASRRQPGQAGQAQRVLPARRSWLAVWVPPLVAFAVAALAWQLYAQGHPYVLPTIPKIVSSITGQPGFYWHNALITLSEVAVGLTGGTAAAMLVAVLMVEAPLFERALLPPAVVLNVTPIIAIAPGLVIAFGFGAVPKYLVTAIIVFYPFLVNAVAGLRSVDPETMDVLGALHASRWETFYRLRLPSSLPFLFAGARICLPLSVVGAVVAEFSAAGHLAGLGSLIQVSSQQGDLTTIWASTLLLAVLGVVLTVLLGVAQSRVLWWDRPPRRGR